MSTENPFVLESERLENVMIATVIEPTREELIEIFTRVMVHAGLDESRARPGALVEAADAGTYGRFGYGGNSTMSYLFVTNAGGRKCFQVYSMPRSSLLKKMICEAWT